MAYPPSRLRAVVARAFTDADSTAIRLRSLAGALDAQMAAGPVTATLILDDLLAELLSSRAVLIASKNTSGILDYARDQFDDPAIDLPTEFNALIAALDAVVTWIVDNFPTGSPGAGNWLERFQLAADGTLTDRSFSTAQTAGLRTNLQALFAAIE